MADLTASLEVNITGSNAQAQAASIGSALEAMGSAGEAAAAKVASVGTASQSLFQRIASASGPGATVAGLSSLTAEANRAQDAFEKLQAFAIGMAQAGDEGSAGMARIADKSAAAAAAIQEVITKMGSMISEGAAVNDTISVMTARLSQIGAKANFTGGLQAEFQGLVEEFSTVADQQTSIAERTRIATQAIEQFGAAARTAGEQAANALKAVDNEANTVRVRTEALRQQQTSPLGAVTKL